MNKDLTFLHFLFAVGVSVVALVVKDYLVKEAKRREII